MLYTINLDENNYILSIAHTQNDEQELDMSTIEPKYMNCYKYANGVATLDEAKKAEQDRAEAEQKAREQEEALKPTVDDLTEALAILTDIVLGGAE